MYVCSWLWERWIALWRLKALMVLGWLAVCVFVVLRRLSHSNRQHKPQDAAIHTQAGMETLTTLGHVESSVNRPAQRNLDKKALHETCQHAVSVAPFSFSHPSRDSRPLTT